MRLLWNVLEHRERVQLVLLLLAMLGMAVFELAGVVSILPFMELVSRPEAVEDQRWLAWAYETLGFESTDSFLIATGMLVLVAITISNVVNLFTNWFQQRFAWHVAHTLATRLLDNFARKPYAYFLVRNTSAMAKQVLAEVNQLTSQLLLPATEFLARTMVTVLILGFLWFVRPTLTAVVVVVLGGTYLVIYLGVRKYLQRAGERRTEAVESRFKAANETLTGIKPIKVADLEGFFVDRFKGPSKRYAKVQARYAVIGKAPRFLVETIAFGGLVLIILFLLSVNDGMAAILPTLSLYAVAGYRLLPALQKLFHALASIRYHYPLLGEITEDLKSDPASECRSRARQSAERPLEFDRGITFRGVTFVYPNSSEEVIRSVDLRIARGSSVAFTGPTGSGKTTLTDLLLGLLEPTRGRIFIDQRLLDHETMDDWRSMVGYVPQEVFLFDDSVARNIALGVPDAAIDMDRVRKVARIAEVHEFIERSLENGYETNVGERGIRLSGGQQQRLGLARALYRNPRVLVLDEATNALDGITEAAVLHSISRLPQDLTVVTVAHRLTTVRDCDVIYVLREGAVVGEGSYEQLVQANYTFRGMANLRT